MHSTAPIVLVVASLAIACSPEASTPPEVAEPVVEDHPERPNTLLPRPGEKAEAVVGIARDGDEWRPWICDSGSLEAKAAIVLDDDPCQRTVDLSGAAFVEFWSECPDVSAAFPEEIPEGLSKFMAEEARLDRERYECNARSAVEHDTRHAEALRAAAAGVFPGEDRVLRCLRTPSCHWRLIPALIVARCDAEPGCIQADSAAYQRLRTDVNAPDAKRALEIMKASMACIRASFAGRGDPLLWRYDRGEVVLVGPTGRRSKCVRAPSGID